ncbi:MAG TPA: AMP-binding protein, partial [Gemmataceae bacterium]|jgi:long-chain acyl-CoA synthetase|nr:AMP-binding protein [Gemmataceae bacterium]
MTEAVGPFDAAAVFFNWLPLSHIYARLCDAYLALLSGSTLAFAESQATIVADLAEMRPTHFTGVPRFYEKILASVPCDRLSRIFAGIRWLSSGGAPLPIAVLDAYREAGLVIHQGYGLTETAPVISTNRRHANRPGTVGLPIRGALVRIAEDGEILTRGPHVMAGYWKHPSPVVDGWLPTGDLGRLDDDGFLTITGRKKELIVLSGGKNVAPNRIEALLVRVPAIEQAIVVGDGRPYLTALVVPRLAKVDEAELLRRIEAALVDVAPWERVRKIAIVEPFTVDAGELTVSAKLRRGVICAKHRERIDAMYI